MTDTLSRPIARPRLDPAPPASPLLQAAAVAALGAAARGLLPPAVVVLASWLAEDRARGSLGGALDAAAQLWLVGHGAWLHVPGGRTGLVPLGLLVLVVLSCRRAAARLARQVPGRRPLALAGALTAVYAALAGAVALLGEGRSVHALPVTAVLAAVVVCLPSALWGASPDGVRALADRLPDGAREPAVAGVTAVGALLTAGALVGALSLVLHVGTVHRLAQAAEPGAVGGLGLLLVSAALVPNAVVWGASWLAGPGFAVGVGTSVGPLGTDLGPVPALPLLGALPGGAPPTAVGLLVLLVPVLAGALGGTRLSRRSSWPAVAVGAASCGAWAGLLAGVLALLSGGPVGGGRLAAVGPSPWRVALAVAVEVAVGAGGLLAVRRLRSTR